MKPVILAVVVFLSVILCAGVAYKVYKHNHAVVQTQTQHDLVLRTVEVFEDKGDEFYLTLANGSIVHAMLDVHALPSSHKDVLELIGSAKSAKAVIVKKKGDDLVIDIVLSIKNKDVSLTQWLMDNKLVFGSNYE